MAVRDDLTINWGVSPRIIEVAAPSVELKVQDLYDTIRNKAASIEGMDEPEIIDGSGKEILSATELVGLTVKLFNAKVKFEDRSSATDCDIYGGNLVAVDANNQSMSPIQYATYVTVTYAKSSSATLVQSADITYIKQKEAGRWKIENYQLTYYDEEGVTPLRVFNLYDKNGVPTNDNPYERVPVS